MKIYNMSRDNQGRGVVLIVSILVIIDSLLQLAFKNMLPVSIGLHIGFALLAVRVIVAFFQSRRLAELAWVQVDGTAVTWSTSPKAIWDATPSGSLNLADVTEMAVVPFTATTKSRIKKISLSLFAVHVTMADGRTVKLPVSSTKIRISVPMQQLLTALAGVPGAVTVDASALAGITPAPVVGKATATA